MPRTEIIPVNLLWVMPAKGDVIRIVIVGAGVLGAGAAFHLAASGAQVTVADAGLQGRATAAGRWDHLSVDVVEPVLYRLYASGGEYYPDLVAALSKAGQTDTGYRRAGAMVVSGDVAELRWIERMLSRRAEPETRIGFRPAAIVGERDSVRRSEMLVAWWPRLAG